MRATLFVILLAADASAGNHELTVGSSSRAMHSSSAEAVTTEGLSGGAVGYAHALGIDLLSHVALWVEGGFAWGGAQGTMFQSLSTRVSTQALTGGARLRYTPYHYLAVGVRADLGAARTALWLDEGSVSASDARWTELAQAAAAVDLLAIDHPQFALGLRFEVGYVATRGVALTPTPQHGGDTLRLPMIESSLGSLDLSGPFVEISAVSQF